MTGQIDLVRVDDKILAQHGDRDLGAHQGQKIETALKVLLVGQHRDGGGVTVVDAGDGGRIKVVADQPLGGRGLLALENEAGALSRVSGLFSARGYNIESLTVAPTEDASLSRMTIVTSGSDDIVEQITKHLNKLVEVVKVVDLSESAHVERELMLVKVRATGKEREEMKRMADIFRGRIIDVTDTTYVIELTGTQAKLDSFVGAIDAGLILETVRSGICGVGRGDRLLKV